MVDTMDFLSSTSQIKFTSIEDSSSRRLRKLLASGSIVINYELSVSLSCLYSSLILMHPSFFIKGLLR